ncbi:type II toxin-antitoxin system death-on-curing family toxin [Nostoc sp. 'Peltigera membranacea cyanobiont' 210A]|uniref:type II toxin-antitoxin system death-on-curing family toxin n=1 Tax=Nostoc sp. 'Peltigera membranacea cyanobiont' 210A TaxID=2014529 RepID=UPI000B95AD42|nr:type II toxin-antitoxin system death-on-curing family toxin [Nostoc sp. 'Peltigera membranacea cyanobiont' 210A]OYD96787.1 type II toxin-antitoxin system death-on-curing family toxin [Nostoc sp. 'Peltigera membranacea cyanobiont' 210A]
MQTPRFISISQVLDIHQDEINSFGGTSGVRDKGLLDSALAQPQATFGGKLLHPTIHQQAAAYLYHLTMNHPFIDGNKRTAFAVMDTFITLNGYTLNLSQEQAYNLVIQVVQKEISKEELSAFLELYLQGK